MAELTKESEREQKVKTKAQDLAPITKSLAGLLKGKEYVDIKEDKAAYLRKKHGF
ncbi:toxin-antitoxin system, antitoxin component [Leptospira weilii]|nr:toxin-antitoxin system, antitoxin component [Leptospira weilii]QDK28622.1 toxin-antitoxin system, antitoxin component [Leptospira weilii]